MVKNEQTRENILKAALQIFSEKGYHDAKVSDIVKEAGVAQGTFYLYFKNKESVFTCILETALQSIVEQNERILVPNITPEATKEEVEESLYQAIRGSMSVIREYRSILYMVRKHGAQFPDAVKVMEEFEGNNLRIIKKLLQRCSFFPEYGPNGYEVVVYAISGVIEKTSMNFMVFRDCSDEELSKIARVVTEMLCLMTCGRD